jgi:Leucine-rich repeat (LRR) protein
MTQIINFFGSIVNSICDNIEYINLNKKRRWCDEDFIKWCKYGRPINKNVVILYILYSNIKSLGRMENLINLEYLCCKYNQLISLEGIEKLVNLKGLYCHNNKLTSLEGMGKLVDFEILEEIENLVEFELFILFKQ